MTTLDDVVDAWNGIEQARQTATEHYRAVLRQAIAEGVKQADILRSIDRSREMLRRDAMPEEERAALRQAATDRARRQKAAMRTARKRSKPGHNGTSQVD